MRHDAAAGFLPPVSAVVPFGSRASTLILSTGRWNGFNQRPENRAVAPPGRSQRMHPRAACGLLLFSASARSCDVWPSRSVTAMTFRWTWTSSCLLLGGRRPSGHHRVERLDRVVQLLRPLDEDLRRVVDRLDADVLGRRLVEGAEDERVGVDLLDQLVGPVGRVADVGDRPLMSARFW